MSNRVEKLLKKFGVSTETWGIGEAKTLVDLKSEIESGETILIETWNGLVRKTTVLYIDVHCFGFLLQEHKQIFADGRIRRRKLAGSLAEKLKDGESSDIFAVQRAIEEELGIPSRGIKQVHFLRIWSEVIDSPSYPGLQAQFVNYKVSVDISKDFFRCDGYREVQPDKTTYFVWGI